jgi:hypothetical protein
MLAGGNVTRDRIAVLLAVGLSGCTPSKECPENGSSAKTSPAPTADSSKTARAIRDIVANVCAYRQQNDAYDLIDLTFAIPLREENPSGFVESVHLYQLSCGLAPPGVPNPQRWKCNGARLELTGYLQGDKLEGPVPLTEYAGVDFRLVRRAGPVFTIKSEYHPFAGQADVDAVEIKIDFSKGVVEYLAESTKGTQVFKTVRGSATCEPINWPPGTPPWKNK